MNGMTRTETVINVNGYLIQFDTKSVISSMIFMSVTFIWPENFVRKQICVVNIFMKNVINDWFYKGVL